MGGYYMEKVIEEFDYFYKDTLCTNIKVFADSDDILKDRVVITNYVEDPFYKAFGVHEEVSYEEYERFLESRCFPKSRINRRKLLHDLGLGHVGYDPSCIVRKTYGMLFTDMFWLRKSEDNTTFEEARKFMLLD